MNQHTKLHQSFIRSGSACTLLLTIAMLFTFMASPLAYAQGVPGGNVTNPVVSAVDVAKPAVVRIITTVPSRLTVHLTAGGPGVLFPRDGTSYQMDYLGSGAFVSSHGDIVTADHVVHPPNADMTDALYQIAAQDVADYLNSVYGITPALDATQVYYSLLTGSFRSEPAFDAPKSQVYLSTSYTGPQSAKNFKSIDSALRAPIDTIKRESPVDMQDLAIVHINMDDTPSIALGDSGVVSEQDELTIIGFPGNADISTRRDPTQMLTSSVNKIYVSAIKQSDDGTSLIQVSGNVEHGDSGGPALDSAGHIVGIVSFHKGDDSQPDNTSFLHVSQDIQNMLTALNISTKPGKFQTAWQQAFTDYTSAQPGHWHSASKAFMNLSKAYPTFNAVKAFADYASAQAKNERMPDKTPKSTAPSLSPYLFIALGILVLLIVAALVFFLTRKKSQPAIASSGSNGSMNSTYAVPANNQAWPTQNNAIANTPGSWGQPTSVPGVSASSTNGIMNASGQAVISKPNDINAWSQPAPVIIPWEKSTQAASPWNTLPAAPQTLVPSVHNHAESRQQSPAALPAASKEPPTLWSRVEISAEASPLFPKEQKQEGPEEITGKQEVVKKESPFGQIVEAAKSQEPELQYSPSVEKVLRNTPFDQQSPQFAHSGAGAARPEMPSFSWPAPTTWQQAGVLTNETRRGSGETPQLDFGKEQ